MGLMFLRLFGIIKLVNMTSKKILVTGGAGFIGSTLADRLLDLGHNIFVIDDLSGGNKENLNSKFQFFKCDLRSVQKTHQIIKSIKPEIVYHLAANAAENKSQFSPIDITSRNWNTFINVLVPSIRYGVKRVIVTSSIAVYGALPIPFKENDVPHPEDLYGVSKFAIEETLKILSKVHGFEFVITRPHNVYGPRQNMSDPYRNVVTIFMNSLLKKKPYYIYGDGEQRRCFSYIDDVVEALVNCGFLNVNGMTFNIGSDKDYSIKELSAVIQKIANVNIPPIHISDRPQEVRVAVSDHTLALKFLHYKDRTSITEGIQATWNYVQKKGYQKPKFTKVEIENPQIPTNWVFKKTS